MEFKKAFTLIGVGAVFVLGSPVFACDAPMGNHASDDHAHSPSSMGQHPAELAMDHHTNQKHAGEWTQDGWIQWHPQTGHGRIAKIGTQSFFDRGQSLELGCGCGATPEAHAAAAPRGCEGPACDQDGDGVRDYLDHCPNTSPFAKVDALGCTSDSDFDGVPNHADSCAQTPEGQAVNAHGCSLDDDADGVVNATDECKDTRLGVKVDSKGCSVPLVTVILFDAAKDGLTTNSKSALKEVAGMLKSKLGLRVQIQGFADIRGSAAKNVSLSNRRAMAAKKFLIKAGVAENRLAVVGFGATRPVAYDLSKDDLSKNRRVEIYVVRDNYSVPELDSVR